MKNIFIISLVSVFSFNACEDPIEVTLDDANAQIVVDAWLTNLGGVQEIKLTKTQPYFDNTYAKGIENASITVSNSLGTQFDFVHTENGSYTYDFTPHMTDGSFGDISEEYTLDILVDGQVLSATAVLNRVPVIDSIIQEYIDDDLFRDEGIYCEFFARDLPGLGDTYWIKTFRDGQYLNKAVEINLAYDAGFDSGGEVDGFVFITPIRDFINPTNDDDIQSFWNTGEEIRIEIHSISNDAFAFLEIMRDQLLNSSSGIFAEPLANTKGNIVNQTSSEEILGVFNVSAVSVATLDIQ